MHSQFYGPLNETFHRHGAGIEIFEIGIGAAAHKEPGLVARLICLDGARCCENIPCRGRGNGGLLHVKRIEDAVMGIVRVEDEAGQPSREIELERKPT